MYKRIDLTTILTAKPKLPLKERIEKSRKRKNKIELTCPCGVVFLVREIFAYQGRKYCSKECAKLRFKSY